MIPVCALCDALAPWFVVSAGPNTDLPLQLGDCICKTCALTIPESIELAWISRAMRIHHWDDWLMLCATRPAQKEGH